MEYSYELKDKRPRYFNERDRWYLKYFELNELQTTSEAAILDLSVNQLITQSLVLFFK